MQAAEHGADFPMARKIRGSMTHQQMHDFAVGSEKNKPQHVRPRTQSSQGTGRGSGMTASSQPKVRKPRSSPGLTKRDVESGGAMLGHPARNLGSYKHPKGGY